MMKLQQSFQNPREKDAMTRVVKLQRPRDDAVIAEEKPSREKGVARNQLKLMKIFGLGRYK